MSIFNIIKELYPPTFQNAMATPVAGWRNRTEAMKEAYLRHQMCCALLANNIDISNPSEGVISIALGEEPEEFSVPEAFAELHTLPTAADIAEDEKEVAQEDYILDRDRQPFLLTSSSSSNEEEQEEEESPIEHERGEKRKFDEMEDEDEFDYMEMIEEEEPPIPVKKKMGKRVIMLEGINQGRLTQERLADEWETQAPSNLYDLADNLQMKFIEVKVTTNVSATIQDFRAKAQNEPPNCKLLIVDLREARIIYDTGLEQLPGHEKCLDFILKRQQLFEQYNIDILSLEKSYLKYEELFDQETREKAEHWMKDILNASRMPARTDKYKPLNFEENDIFDFINLLEDPRKRTGEEICMWNGKLLPTVLKKAILMDNEYDVEIVKKILKDLKIYEEHTLTGKGRKPTEQFKDCLNDLTEATTFAEQSSRIFTVRKKNQSVVIKEETLKRLGVSMKGGVHSSKVTCKQPEYKEHKKRKYEDYMSTLISLTSKKHPYKEMKPFKDLQSTKLPNCHPIDEISNGIWEGTMKMFLETHVALMLSETINWASRMGGHYLIDDKKGTTHATIAVWPLYFNLYGINEQKNGVTGIMFRGPHHVRTETDKVNIVTVEFLSDAGAEFVYKYCKNGSIISSSVGLLYVKQNAVERGAFSFFVNCTNVLLPVVNIIGERIFKTLNEGGEISMAQEMISRTLLKYRTFYAWKLSEASFWSLLARSQEEGGMAIIRKIGMQIIARSLTKRKMCFLQPKELADKVNECVIDAPLISYYVSKLIDFLRYIKDRNGGSFVLNIPLVAQ